MPDLYFYRSAEEIKKEEEDLQRVEEKSALAADPLKATPLPMDMPAIVDWAAEANQ